jgi:Domain of unknown function (DUF4399)
MRIALCCAAAMLIAVIATPAIAQRTKAPEDAKAYIISPADGETVSNPITVRFGLSGMGIAPAGVDQENTGHHHLLIDVDPASIEFDDPLPSDDNHRHFGGGQTETTIELPAGVHTLILLLGDQNHISLDPPVMSEPVTITVR